MCGDTNCHWARCYFNKNVSLHMQVRMTSCSGARTLIALFVSSITTPQGLTLEDIRHVWILLTQQAVATYCTAVDQETKKMLLEVAARLSGHSPPLQKY